MLSLSHQDNAFSTSFIVSILFHFSSCITSFSQKSLDQLGTKDNFEFNTDNHVLLVLSSVIFVDLISNITVSSQTHS